MPVDKKQHLKEVELALERLMNHTSIVTMDDAQTFISELNGTVKEMLQEHGLEVYDLSSDFKKHMQEKLNTLYKDIRTMQLDTAAISDTVHASTELNQAIKEKEEQLASLQNERNTLRERKSELKSVGNSIADKVSNLFDENLQGLTNIKSFSRDNLPSSDQIIQLLRELSKTELDGRIQDQFDFEKLRNGIQEIDKISIKKTFGSSEDTKKTEAAKQDALLKLMGVSFEQLKDTIKDKIENFTTTGMSILQAGPYDGNEEEILQRIPSRERTIFDSVYMLQFGDPENIDRKLSETTDVIIALGSTLEALKYQNAPAALNDSQVASSVPADRELAAVSLRLSALCCRQSTGFLATDDKRAKNAIASTINQSLSDFIQDASTENAQHLLNILALEAWNLLSNSSKKGCTNPLELSLKGTDPRSSRDNVDLQKDEANLISLIVKTFELVQNHPQIKNSKVNIPIIDKTPLDENTLQLFSKSPHIQEWVSKHLGQSSKNDFRGKDSSTAVIGQLDPRVPVEPNQSSVKGYKRN